MQWNLEELQVKNMCQEYKALHLKISLLLFKQIILILPK